jgi:hypothetical protein
MKGLGCGCGGGCNQGTANYTLNGLGKIGKMGDWWSGWSGSENTPGPGPVAFSQGGWYDYYLPGMMGLGQLDTSSVSGFISSVPNWLQEPSAIFPGVANWVLILGVGIAADLYLGKRGRR